eukprot:CAMPEP_0195075368 /NCGR_PEP_ID=MMETSP0448-20130528/18258_1 /TAXON_ID=66468 /ORGANISM="Heterocapsa triquestra, Strain CCMP 448" /LENGTH=59 /DNA_ID=CAMNT_0040107749 /DNA_START=18 /DNA_END=194 /DNA_ORIENTATION=+
MASCVYVLGSHTSARRVAGQDKSSSPCGLAAWRSLGSPQAAPSQPPHHRALLPVWRWPV